MLSDESKLIYNILRNIAGDDDVYKIIEADEVIERLPEGVSFTKVQLSSTIKDLKERDYINVKYFTPDEYCLLTLKRVEEEPQVQSEVANSQDEGDEPKKERILYDKNDGKIIVKGAKAGVTFLMAFLGALLGSTIVAVVVVILSKTVF